jgi:BioD-like phosphotransacetylase family protein
VQADEAGDPTKLAKRKLQLLRERAERRKQNSIEKVQRLRLLNLSTKEMEVKHFLPKSRLESYGLE